MKVLVIGCDLLLLGLVHCNFYQFLSDLPDISELRSLGKLSRRKRENLNFPIAWDFGQVDFESRSSTPSILYHLCVTFFCNLL